MDHSTTNSPVASPPDPPQDHSATSAPSNIEIFLHAVGILLTYSRHLIDTVRHHATAPRFNAIAAGFGTGNLSTILAHLNRGVLRAAALERILLARIAAGKDIDMVLRRIPPRPAPSPSPPPPSLRLTSAHPARPAPPAGMIPNSSCPPWRNLNARYAAVPPAAPSSTSVSISLSSQCSVTALSGTNCSSS